MVFGSYGIYLLFSLPALLLGLWAQFKVKTAFNRYSKMRSFTGLTGAEVARHMLNSNGLNDVQVEEVQGFLSDHYDPTTRTLRLSQTVYRSNSLAAAGVAAHESGHALQHAEGYSALKFRTAMVPSVQLGSWLGPIIFVVGYFFHAESLSWAGILLFGATALFALVTLPVEMDATRRAKAWLSTSGVIYNTEMEGIHSVLDAAALTYVAAAVQAISTVLYYVFLLLGRDRD